ncbi:hypothetical protein AERO8C_140019 [Aeromonas veronii]|uniref:Uncharacterized protein n=1 Tax=Aeromonas veronii TaxID=654 RepID=A0A653KSS6_AERVE|nr:hypothetical protein AERO8C_140019 [Aeromonas veronii]
MSNISKGNCETITSATPSKSMLHHPADNTYLTYKNTHTSASASGQLNPDTWLGRTSACAGGIPSLW